MPAPVRVIIFDLDGTLVNAYPAVSQSVNAALKSLGFPRKSYDAIKRAVGWGDRQLLAQFVGEALADKAIQFYRPHHAKALVAPGGVKFLAGTKSLLAALHAQGYTLAIASNRPTRFTLEILKVLDMRPYFRIVLCADRLPKGKPDPQILWTILKRLKVERDQALFVGDMTIDVETGNRAGVKTIAVTTGSSSIQELKRLKPYRIINRIGQLRQVLKDINVVPAGFRRGPKTRRTS